MLLIMYRIFRQKRNTCDIWYLYSHKCRGYRNIWYIECIYKAQIISNYFLNIPGNLNIQAAKNNDFIPLLEKHYPYAFPPMQTVPVTEGEIRGIINSMKPKNSSGYDGISTKILKLSGSQISKSFAFIIDKSIKTGVFPECLMYAVITPLHKRGDVSDIANYWPISLLPAFSKILEKAMHSRLNQHLQTNNILATEQYGFRKGLSTEQATYSLTNNILMAWNKKIIIGGIFCDLTKTFDCVNHLILVSIRCVVWLISITIMTSW